MCKEYIMYLKCGMLQWMKDILLHDLGDTTSVQGHDTSLSNQQQLIKVLIV